MTQSYNAPLDGAPSSIGSQIRTDFFKRRALIEVVKDQYFQPLADVTAMPKHYGKKIKQYLYIPMLDDRNVNDMGIDASGATILNTEYTVSAPLLANVPTITDADGGDTADAHVSGDIVYSAADNKWYLLIADRAAGSNLATADTLKSDADIKAYIEADTLGVTATVANGVITLDSRELKYSTEAAANIAVQIIGGTVARQGAGSLYGSSKDIGTIAGKLPVLGEDGGRVNRVGFTRVEIEGEISKMGIFTDYTKDSLQFDSDAELEMHVHREMLRGASEITEDVLQMDLLAGAGVIRYAGAATSAATVTGDTGSACVVDYEDLMRLGIDLNDNRTPKQTKIISGSKMTDTRVVAGGRFIYCGSEMIPTFERMVDLHNNPAFVSVEHYAAAGNLHTGEIGKVGQFRIIVVPEMQHWAGVGAVVGSNAGYRETGNKYDVFPLLVVGEGSFTTIGFQTSGKSFKFEIFHKKPGREMADLTNPYGEKGFMSIKWWYGTMILRPERLAVLKAVAEI